MAPPPPTAPATTPSISPPATTSCIWARSAQATGSSGTAARGTGTPPRRSRSAGPRPRTSPCRERSAGVAVILAVTHPVPAPRSLHAKTITGLTNGTAHTFKVAAKNTNGTGPDSAASNEITPHAPLNDWTAYVDPRTSSNSNNNAANVLQSPRTRSTRTGRAPRSTRRGRRLLDHPNCWVSTKPGQLHSYAPVTSCTDNGTNGP